MLALDCNMHTVAEKWDPPFLYPQRLRILSIRKSFYTKSARHDDSSYRDTRGSTARSPAKHKPARLHASTINTPDRKRCHSGHHICPSLLFLCLGCIGGAAGLGGGMYCCINSKSQQNLRPTGTAWIASLLLCFFVGPLCMWIPFVIDSCYEPTRQQTTVM
eukprot:COSAG03_NODE_3055_length_2259_cov_18.001852_2_plen_161_part_00